MKHVPELIQSLIQKYLDGNATQDEKKILDEWYYNFSPKDLLLLSDEAENAAGNRMKSRLDAYVVYEGMVAKSKSRSRFTRAALVLSLIGISAVLYYFVAWERDEKKMPTHLVAGEVVKDISPGGNKAILTLGDGSTIVLDSSSNGQLGTQGNTKVIKLDDGQLRYQREKGLHSNKETVYNTIATPRGGQYQIALADGSNVWLNASSSIRFPTEFRDSVRNVEITGEAYFEIAHNRVKPFRVKVKDMYVNVIGTHFNVMAYDDEDAVHTTLLEGSLRVSNASGSKLITPGQQAVLNSQGSFRVVDNADVEEAIAWKNGRFLFNSADIHSIMRQIERWYNVDVRFERDADLHFTGQLSRNVNVSQLLRKLELTNEINFRIEKGKITVLP